MLLQSKSSEEKGVGFDCELCIANELMGVKNGRICLIHQIDFDNDTLEYGSYTKSSSVSGIINSIDSFHNGLSELLILHKTEYRVESALKQIKHGRQSGICIKSFPQSELTTRLLKLLMLCMGGFNGTELTHLPNAGTILDQSNIFINAYNIYVSEHNRFIQEGRKQDKKDK